MKSRIVKSSTVKSIVVCTLAIAALAGCSGDSKNGGTTPTGSVTAGTTESTSAKPYLPVPKSVKLTAPGTKLSLGDPAQVAWRAREGDRATEVGVLTVDVTKVEQVPVKAFAGWRLSDGQRTATPYFVSVTIQNVGKSDLSGVRVPLYVLNDKNQLVESTPFAAQFKRCPSTPLPAKFGAGKTTTSCLVYLVPKGGKLAGVSFRPTETFDPIVWADPVAGTPSEPKPGPKTSGTPTKPATGSPATGTSGTGSPATGTPTTGAGATGGAGG